MRLRTFCIFVTKFVKIYTILYSFLWVFLVLNYVFCFFSLAWLFVGLFFRHPDAEQSKHGRILGISPSFWGVSRRILGVLPSSWTNVKDLRFITIILCDSEEFYIPHTPLLLGEGTGMGFSKKYYIYNIMSYPTFRHQQKSKN